jgi:hypothetical protein
MKKAIVSLAVLRILNAPKSITFARHSVAGSRHEHSPWLRCRVKPGKKAAARVQIANPKTLLAAGESPEEFCHYRQA